MTVGLGLTRLDGESWLECAVRYAKPHGLEAEIRQFYRWQIERGRTEAEAAWAACMEWDVCDLREVDDETKVI